MLPVSLKLKNLFQMDITKKFAERAHISYDAINQRIRKVEEVYFNEDREYYDVLWLHNEGMEYRLNLKTKMCNVTALTRPFRKIGIPANAKSGGEAYIGSSVANDGVLVSLWSETTEQGAKYYGSWTYPACVPVSDYFYDSSVGLVQTHFYNVEVGISDPDRFIPPMECKKP
ncbi:mammalian ependymin-related protein 1-like [Lingula anatina]|uniref:Mammalian ependymin-related protein 1-like n=1 Tax=Lingula anatina TaxID=7574 RepID=A0A1S3ISH7_LINAN|nr:mammalian ependymin-related protein 1-like [Lingula anatina]|eukprot:XP_013400489.1 mammalian ependymin-related protein 1-like [Lingula anatina]